MATGRQIITAALINGGVVSANNAPTASDMDLAIGVFNDLIGSRSTDFLNIHTVRPYRFFFVAGQRNYTLGPTGTWNITRPMRLERVNIMMNPVLAPEPGEGPSTMYIPCRIVDDAEFADLNLQGIRNQFPTKVVDLGGYPDRTLSFYPIPVSGGVAAELWLWEPLSGETLDSELNYPPGYDRYFIWSLTIELADVFQYAPTETMIQNYQESARVVRALNQITTVVQPTDRASRIMRRTAPVNYIDFITGSWMLPRRR